MERPFKNTKNIKRDERKRRGRVKHGNKAGSPQNTIFLEVRYKKDRKRRGHVMYDKNCFVLVVFKEELI